VLQLHCESAGPFICKVEARQAGLLEDSRISVNGTQELQLVHPSVLFCLKIFLLVCLCVCLLHEGFTALVPISVMFIGPPVRRRRLAWKLIKNSAQFVPWFLFLSCWPGNYDQFLLIKRAKQLIKETRKIELYYQERKILVINVCFHSHLLIRKSDDKEMSNDWWRRSNNDEV